MQLKGGLLLDRFDVIVVGDANIDLIVEGCNSLPLLGEEIRVKNISTNIGGGAALCAMGLSKLGMKTAFCGVMANDLYGSFIMNEFEKNNVEVYCVKHSKMNSTGITIAVFGENDRSFITFDGANSEFDLCKVDLETVSLARHIHLTGYRGNANHKKFMEFIYKLKQVDVTISTDVGWDDTGEWFSGIFELISHVDVFFINEIEALNYTKCKDIKESLNTIAKYCKNVAIKMGAKGAIGRRGDETAYEEALSVEVVDTTGAGDSFNAGYVYGFLKGEKLRKCLIYGNACGALSVTKQGGNTGFPDEIMLENFIKDKVNIITKKSF